MTPPNGPRRLPPNGAPELLVGAGIALFAAFNLTPGTAEWEMPEAQAPVGDAGDHDGRAVLASGQTATTEELSLARERLRRTLLKSELNSPLVLGMLVAEGRDWMLTVCDEVGRKAEIRSLAWAYNPVTTLSADTADTFHISVVISRLPLHNRNLMLIHHALALESFCPDPKAAGSLDDPEVIDSFRLIGIPEDRLKNVSNIYHYWCQARRNEGAESASCRTLKLRHMKELRLLVDDVARMCGVDTHIDLQAQPAVTFSNAFSAFVRNSYKTRRGDFVNCLLWHALPDQQHLWVSDSSEHFDLTQLKEETAKCRALARAAGHAQGRAAFLSSVGCIYAQLDSRQLHQSSPLLYGAVNDMAELCLFHPDNAPKAIHLSGFLKTYCNALSLADDLCSKHSLAQSAFAGHFSPDGVITGGESPEAEQLYLDMARVWASTMQLLISHVENDCVFPQDIATRFRSYQQKGGRTTPPADASASRRRRQDVISE